MRKSLTTLGVVALAIILATSAFAANKGVSFKPIGFIHPWDPGPYPASLVTGMTADGSMLLTSPSPYGAYCTLTDPETLEWTLIGGTAGQCVISADGSTVMSTMPDPETGWNTGATWTGVVDEWTDYLPFIDGFEPCGSSGQSFYDMGGNGDYMTGLTWKGCSYARGFWSDGETTIDTGSANGESTRGNAITTDGSKIAGWNQMLCGSRAGATWEGGAWSMISPNGTNEPKVCVESGGGCCSDTYCPEYVDDSSCNNAGYCDLEGIECLAGVCTGGANAGGSCSGYWNCPGYCSAGSNAGGECTSDYSCPGTCVGGPNHGGECTSSSSYYCPDTPVCVENPAYNLADWKGEAYDMTPDGSYVVGAQYGSGDWNDPNFDPLLGASAYRFDGSNFDQILPNPGASPYDSWTPYAISDNGKVIVGSYGWWIYSYPVMWVEGMGTVDFQWFLVSQGLDELWFWSLTNLTTVSADGSILGGYGWNPDFWYEGFVVDISKISVCHAPGGDETKERTLTIGMYSVGDHVGHGDFLGTCEFKNSGAHSRSASEFRPERPTTATHPDKDNRWHSEEDILQRAPQYSGESSSDQPARTAPRTGVRQVKHR
jgi:hypothetical protein